MTYCTVHADEKLMSLREYAKAIVQCTFNGQERFHLCFDTTNKGTSMVYDHLYLCKRREKHRFAFTGELYIQAVIAILMTDRWSVCIALGKMQLYTDRMLQNKLYLLLALVSLHKAAPPPFQSNP